MLSPGGNFDAQAVHGEKKEMVIHEKPRKKEREIFESVRYEDLSEPEKKQLTEIGLTIIQGVLDGVQDYTVFASTSLYLHGQKYGIKELAAQAPGDFDCAVESMQTLVRIRSKLSNVPGVEFENNGDFFKFPTDEARKLGGVIHVGLRTAEGIKKVPYEFEFFLNSFIIPDKPDEYQENIHGMKMLSLEGLQKQYQRNLSFEGKVFEETGHVVKFLLQPEIETILRAAIAEKQAHSDDPENAQIPQEAFRIIQHLDIGLDDLATFYKTKEQLKGKGPTITLTKDHGDGTSEVVQQAFERGQEIALTRELSMVISGFKTKVLKRMRDLKRLQKLQRIELP